MKNFKYIDKINIRNYICQSKATLAGMNCLFKTYYSLLANNFLVDLLDSKPIIPLKKCTKFYGKEIKFPKEDNES